MLDRYGKSPLKVQVKNAHVKEGQIMSVQENLRSGEAKLKAFGVSVENDSAEIFPNLSDTGLPANFA